MSSGRGRRPPQAQSTGRAATAVGLLCGLAASMGLTGMLTSLLFDVTPSDPATLALVAGLMLLVSAGACVVPAWRATRVNPLTALRS